MKTSIYLLQHLAQFFLEWENVSDKGVEKIKTHICVLFENLAVNEIMWRNTLESGRPQMTIQLFAIFINEATSTHSEYVRVFSFPLQNSFHEPAAMLRYTYIVFFFWSSIPEFEEGPLTLI